METRLALRIALESLILLAIFVAARLAVQFVLLPADPACGWETMVILLIAAGICTFVLLQATNERRALHFSVQALAMLAAASLVFASSVFIKQTLYVGTALFLLIVLSYLFILTKTSWQKKVSASSDVGHLRTNFVMMLINFAVAAAVVLVMESVF